jgi:hypothetical protein
MRRSVALLLVCGVLLATCFFEITPAYALPLNAWTSKTSMHVARASLGAAVVDGQIYAIGGVTDPPSWVQCTNTNEKYDPAADRWVFKAAMPTPRASFAIAVYNSKIYCIGGTTGAKNGSYVASGVNEVYDPASDTWTTKTGMPTPRVGVTASVVDGKIYLIGGDSNATEVYDPATDSWTTKTSIPVKPALRLIWSCTSAVVDGKIHVFGALPFSVSHQVYDPKADSWSVEAPIIQGYYLAVACSTSVSERIFVFGVDSTWWDIGPPNFTSLAYDAEWKSWHVSSSMPTPRVNVAVAVVDDLVYVIGGSMVMIENNAHPTTINEQYTPHMDQPADIQAPKITIHSPESKTYPSTIQLDFTINKPASTVRFGIDGQSLVAANGNSTLTFQPGVHNITVYAIDNDGNIGASETVNFSVAESQPFPIALIAITASLIATSVAIVSVYFKKTKRKGH